MTPGIMLVSILFIGISLLVSLVLKKKISRYNKIPLSNGLTGKQVAEKMLRENGIFDVQVLSSQGFLSDHYNPVNKTVNLSAEVFPEIVFLQQPLQLMNAVMLFNMLILIVG